MNRPSDSTLQQGLEMTRRMLDLVKSEDWDAVVALGKERLALLKDWNQDTNLIEAQTQIGILQEIQELDQEIETLARRGRDQAAGHLRLIHQGRKADKAYRS
jgi:hypothetical protein